MTVAQAGHRIWATWGRSHVAHAVAGRADSNDVRNGGFPTMCGRWAPDPMDNGVEPRVAPGHMPRCRVCAQKVSP